ncbi:MAG: hypothetical protein GY805_08585 [Chloroflexi bacterium]|nr:hypothetical protein [Chloroflexota bacterium]
MKLIGNGRFSHTSHDNFSWGVTAVFSLRLHNRSNNFLDLSNISPLYFCESQNNNVLFHYHIVQLTIVRCLMDASRRKTIADGDGKACAIDKTLESNHSKDRKGIK